MLHFTAPVNTKSRACWEQKYAEVHFSLNIKGLRRQNTVKSPYEVLEREIKEV
jgi:hypothetical protein